MFPTSLRISRLAAALALVGLASSAQAALVDITVTVENLVPANGISFAPLHFGFNNGSFDAFNLGSVATEAIVSVAEGGAGGAWQAAFAAADPTATRGTLGGLLQPGGTSSATFTVDSSLNRFFTFAAMVVPSNDFFIGNDSPMRYQLFDAAGNLVISSINQTARQIWDAGSEVFDPAASAFVGNNDLRAPQNSVVAFNFAELAAYNGLTTATGYTLDSTLAADTGIYRISFAVAPVPEPETYAMMLAGLLMIGSIARRRLG
ncbi:MAG: spondin domain-containing protein [Methyloversatilis sp.]|nr:spondin domain-containing protein [Methyloversatilis sp.]